MGDRRITLKDFGATNPAAVQRALVTLPGVESAIAFPKSHSVRIRYNPEVMTDDEILAALRRDGLVVPPWDQA